MIFRGTTIEGEDATLQDAASIDELADRLGAALGTGDAAALDALFSPGFSIWYNFSDDSLDRAQAMAFFADYFTRVSVRFSDIKRLATPTGWVQQHRVDADGADGFQIRNMPACLVVTIDGGKIAHIAEYLDSAQTAGFDSSRMHG